MVFYTEYFANNLHSKRKKFKTQYFRYNFLPSINNGLSILFLLNFLTFKVRIISTF